MSKASRLRGLLKDNEIIVAPGAYDALSAKIIESMGFPLVYVGGYASSAAYLGEPDIGLMSFAEVIDNLRRINMAIDIPVIADADNGYGNAINGKSPIITISQAQDLGFKLMLYPIELLMACCYLMRV
jgi:2-methylisocitrate lyase-like PEP mutase family enzyme